MESKELMKDVYLRISQQERCSRLCLSS